MLNTLAPGAVGAEDLTPEELPFLRFEAEAQELFSVIDSLLAVGLELVWMMAVMDVAGPQRTAQYVAIGATLAGVRGSRARSSGAADPRLRRPRRVSRRGDPPMPRPVAGRPSCAGGAYSLSLRLEPLRRPCVTRRCSPHLQQIPGPRRNSSISASTEVTFRAIVRFLPAPSLSSFAMHLSQYAP